MTAGPTRRMEVAGPRAHGDAADLSNVTPLAERTEAASSAPPITATNVIPFVRARRESVASGPAPDIVSDPAQRPAPHLIGRERRVQIVALLALSLAAHCGLYVLFNREPEPMPSIGLESISVEILVGDNRPLAVTQVESVPADHPNPNPLDPDTTTAKVEETRPIEVKPVQEPQRLAPNSVTEVAPERPRPEMAETPSRRATETPPDRSEQQQQVAVLRAEETPVPHEPELSSTPEEPAKVTATEHDKPEPVKTETRPQSQPKAAPKQEAKKKQEMRPKERSGPEQRTASRESNSTGRRQIAVSGGLGPSQLNSNYPGTVFAHLARQKRFPPEARSRGEQGTATVAFGLDGGGRVTRVSLVRGTGSATLDQEATAMVRRASPFPAPPGGRPQSFTAPVSFRIQ